MDHLPMLLKSTVERLPDKEAIIHADRRITYRELWEDVASLSNHLLEHRVSPGDGVGILIQNSPEFIVGLYAIYSVGGIAVPIDPDVTLPNLKFQLNNSSAVSLLTQKGYLDLLKHAEGDIPSLRSIIICDSIEDVEVDWFSSTRVLKWNKGEMRENFSPIVNDIAQLIHTTGTTGLSKAVILTHKQMIAATNNIVNLARITESDKEVSTLPLVRLFGQYHIYCYHQVGGCLVVENSFNFFNNAKKILNLIIEEEATSFPNVPSVFILLMEKYGELLKNCDLYLRYVMLCSMPISVENIEKLQRCLPNTEIINTYGLSEAVRATFVNVTKNPEKSASVGQPIPGGRVLILNDQGLELPVGEIGEIVLDMPHTFSGYWNNEKETEKVLRNGLLHTGDVGNLDSDGYLYYRGRLKDLINVGGRKFNPIEVETIIDEMDQVKKSIVVGVSDPRGVLGEIPVAFVVVNAGENIDEHEIVSQLKDIVEEYKIPRKFQIVNQFPKTGSGKILRRELKKSAELIYPGFKSEEQL